MSLPKIEKYINILLYLYSHKEATIIQVVNKFNMKYSTVITLFKRWKDDGYLTRIKIKEIKLGQDQYYYEIIYLN